MKKNKSVRMYLLLVAILGLSSIIGCKLPGADTVPPTVDFANPASGATGVPTNRKIVATFSEAMDAETITTATFTVAEVSTPVTGLVTYTGTTATFAPVSNLTANTIYTARITVGVKDLAGNALEAEYWWTFETGVGEDNVAPTVSATTPANDATGVAVNGTISATFGEAMELLTITGATFTLKQGATAVTGEVTYSGVTAVFTPASHLTHNTVYTATITTGAKDLAGNPLAANVVWSFTTGAEADATAPAVISTSPIYSATGVAINAMVTATFSEAMDPLTLTTATFTLKKGTTVIGGTVVAYSGTTATFTPSAYLEASTTYTARVSVGAKDLAGNALGLAHTWSFTTAVADTIPPTVSSTFPVNGATAVITSSNIRATFSEPMDIATMVAANFTVAAGVTPVTGTVTYDLPSKTATFAPAAILATGTTYTATVTTGAKDPTGNALVANKTWTFETANQAAGPAPVRLGTAGNFVILAKTAITTVPASAITGDIGLSPAAESYITGFSQTKATGYSTAPQVTGFIYAADMTPPTPSNMTTAVSDMETAYTDAAGRTLSVVEDLGAGTIGGRTFAPGLYKWGSTVNITTDITLDGDANDVWIFQVTNDLILSSAKQVILAGGAQAKNIFWQVAGIVLLETNSHFEGIILSMTQINMLTGATMNGRALAQTQVTLQQNTVTEPAD